MVIIDAIIVRAIRRVAREYHIAAVGGSNEDEVSVDLADVLNTLGAQDWDLKAAMPFKDSDTLALDSQPRAALGRGAQAGRHGAGGCLTA